MTDLPNDFQAEQTVIGALLLQPSLMDDCTLQPRMFFESSHQIIFETMQVLHEEQKPITAASIMRTSKEYLHDGIEYINNLRKSIPTTANFNYYHDLVRDSSIMREIMLKMRERLRVGDLNTNPTEYLSGTIEALEGILDGQAPIAEMRKLSSYTEEHEKQVIDRKYKKGLTGARSCSKDLNDMMGGYQDGEFTLLAARPSVGKTAYGLNEAVSACDDYLFQNINGAVALFSLEMGGLPMVERVICIIGGIESSKLRTGEMTDDDWQKYHIAKRRLDTLPFYINDKGGQTIQSIERNVKNLRKKHDKVLVLIDFIQLVETEQRGLEGNAKVGYVSKRCKQIARTHSVPVLGISAVGRGVEQRADKRPMMSDLRESGSLESDADNIIFLYRDDYYDKETTRKAVIELIVAKGRNIGVGTIQMAYVKHTNKFLNLDFTHHENLKKAQEREEAKKNEQRNKPDYRRRT